MNILTIKIVGFLLGTLFGACAMFLFLAILAIIKEKKR